MLLYKKYLELDQKGLFQSTLERIYEEGKMTNFKPPGQPFLSNTTPPTTNLHSFATNRTDYSPRFIQHTSPQNTSMSSPNAFQSQVYLSSPFVHRPDSVQEQLFSVENNFASNEPKTLKGKKKSHLNFKKKK